MSEPEQGENEAVALTIFARCRSIALVGKIPPYRAFKSCWPMTTFAWIRRDESTIAAHESSALDSRARTVSRRR